MNRELRKRVTEIAVTVRRWAEDRDRAGQYPSGDLNGLCAIASGELYRRLARNNIRSSIRVTESDYGCHVFSVVDNHVVDVTATQFNSFRGKKIVILPIDEAECHDCFQSCHEFDSASALRDYQIAVKWPKSQTALAR